MKNYFLSYTSLVRKKSILISLVGMALFISIHAAEKPAPEDGLAAYVKIVSVVDGDTLDVKLINMGKIVGKPGKKDDVIRVRLIGVNAPDIPEKGYNEAKKFVKKWVKDQERFAIAVQSKPLMDKYGRALCLILPTEYDGLNSSLNCALLNESHAEFMDIENYLLPAVQKCGQTPKE